MPKNLRTYVADLKAAGEKAFLATQQPVDAKFGLTAVLQKLEQQGRYPAVLFQRVVGSKMPVLANVFASRAGLAMALGVPPSALNSRLRELDAAAIPPKRVEAPPCQEVVLKSPRASLSVLPQIWHNSGDGGPYITGGCAVTAHPDTGVTNLGIYRLMIKDDKRMTVHLSETSHAGILLEEYARLGRPMPIAIAIGHHPAFYLAAVSLGPYGADEYSLAGGYLGEPVTVARAVESGLEVPAESEILVEGEIVPGELDHEGPFGEFTGTYGQVLTNPVITVKAITMRRDPIFLDIFSGHADHQVLAGTPRLSWVFRAARAACPTLSEVYMPPSGCCRFFCFVSIDKRFEGEPKNVAMAVFAADSCARYVVVVDEDVDVFDEEAVMRAIATNVRVPADTFLVERTKGSPLDPTAQDGLLVSKLGIDATRKKSASRKTVSVEEARAVDLDTVFGPAWRDGHCCV
ncbi:MAG: UbiD family decarboxylase [Firmicutes bacterium]|jgi:2,5-furandicarboxylate decarboxylase 1|nr:UbiD family decarboxylase [Bacillota bacterium]